MLVLSNLSGVVEELGERVALFNGVGEGVVRIRVFTELYSRFFHEVSKSIPVALKETHPKRWDTKAAPA